MKPGWLVVAVLLLSGCAEKLPTTPSQAPGPRAGVPSRIELSANPGMGSDAGSGTITARVFDGLFTALAVNALNELLGAVGQPGGVHFTPQINTPAAGQSLEAFAKAVNGGAQSAKVVLLDGAKPLYPEVLSLVESRLRPGALIVADNADSSPEYLERVRSPAAGYMSTPFAEDVELSMRIG